jgi:hypothetical protein
MLKTIPVYDRNPNSMGMYSLLYTIKPHTTDQYIDPEYPDVAPTQVLDNQQFYDFNNNQLFPGKTIDIDCIASQPENQHYEIFLDCDGSVYPCCFIGSRLNYGETQLKDMLGDTDIILSDTNNIYKILASTYYKSTLPAGINGNFEGSLTLEGKTKQCITCVDCCGMKMELSHLKEA